MGAQVPRRRFLQSAAAGGALLGLDNLGFLGRLPLVSARDVRPEPDRVRLRAEIEPLVRLIEDTPRNRLLEEVGQPHPAGDQLQGRARRADARRRAQRSAAARSASNSTRSWWSTRLTWPAWRRRTPSAGCRCSGRSTTSSRPRRRTNGEAGGACARRRGAGAARRAKAKAAFTDAMDDWDEEAADVAVAGSGPFGRGREVFELFAGTAPATSVTSATRPSTSPTHGGRFRRSAGSTPSRCCGRWLTPC